MNTESKPSPHHSPERESRVAAALRENLRKRKQQQALKTDKPDTQTKDAKCP